MESVLNFNSISPICVLNYRLFPTTLSCSPRPLSGDPAVATSRRCLSQRKLSRSLPPASLPSTSANAAASTSNSQSVSGRLTVRCLILFFLVMFQIYQRMSPKVISDAFIVTKFFNRADPTNLSYLSVPYLVSRETVFFFKKTTLSIWYNWKILRVKQVLPW